MRRLRLINFFAAASILRISMSDADCHDQRSSCNERHDETSLLQVKQNVTSGSQRLEKDARADEVTKTEEQQTQQQQLEKQTGSQKRPVIREQPPQVILQ